MPKDPDRFLARAPLLEEGPALGRVFAVVRDSWLLSEDPQAVSPRSEIIVGRRTALEAADLAREAAEAFAQHGFHKPSGAWWGSDRVRLHRFAVRPFRPASQTALIGSGLLALAAVVVLALANTAGKRRRQPQSRA